VAFKTKPDPTFELPVDVPQPGKPTPAKLSLTVAHLGRRALKDWMSRAKGADGDAVWLMEVVKGWGADTVDEKGQPAPFNQAAFDAVLDDYPGAAMAIFEAYVGEHYKAQAKNSVGPSSNG